MPNTFRDLERQLGAVPAPLVTTLGQVDERKGRADAFRLQHLEQLKTLLETARIQSTAASNEIEGVTAPAARIAQLVEGATAPANRSEAEIAGYRAALDLIHASAESMPVTNNVILQLHRDLYQFAAAEGGRFKMTDNTVEEELPDGTRRVRFVPVAAFATPDAMRELGERYLAELDRAVYHPLLLVGSYVFDFLVIHPFADGNGRMSRLVTLMLLYQRGYEVGRYISLEQLIAETKETYYEALASSTAGWHEEQHDILPWLRYFVGILLGAYDRFEQRTAGVVGGRGAKTQAIKQFIRSSASEEFSIDDVRRAAPVAGDALIRKVLHDLRDAGAVQAQGRGRSARWRRLHTDF
jgi:Fic family protein